MENGPRIDLAVPPDLDEICTVGERVRCLVPDGALPEDLSDGNVLIREVVGKRPRAALREWDDLVPYGIHLLTGEACAYAMRGLFDVDEDGQRLMEEFLGTSLSRDPWGGTFDHGYRRGVKSVMLPYNIREQLFAFVLLQQGYTNVIVDKHTGTVTGTDDSEWATKRWTGGHRRYRRFGGGGNQPVVGSRCVHAMSGRVA
jgi:hypothetical protein